jgi:hypothetical protein
MALSPKMLELQDAMNFYGDTTLRNYDLIHKFGDEVTCALADYLGEGAEAFGVNPEKDWTHKNGDHRDAKYSTFRNGYLQIEPVLMGVAIKIPHSKDDGAYWIRVVAEMVVAGNMLTVHVGGNAARGIPLEYSARDVERVQEMIFECARDTMRNPAEDATTEGRRRIGFVDT